ncbi:MAG: thioredoxin-disulfide reductase [Rhodospirillales bacterium]|nr:thioredoxin-disulfide reductase [Rhodospirillales bacterium]
MSQTHRSRVLIIGAGPAGYTAAIYAARAGLSPILVAGLQPGGQLTITTDVENYPGFAEAVQGPWLMEQMAAQAGHVGARLIDDVIVATDLTGPVFTATGDSGDRYEADAVIIATGAAARWLGLPSEKRLAGAGVSACATCDGFFFRGKRVAVVGGGNTAVEEALYLTHHASHVTLIHRRDNLRAEKILQQRLFAHPKVSVLWNQAVEEVLGAGTPETVTGLRLRATDTGAMQEIAVDGLFVAIGHTPNTAIFHGQIGIDAEGYIRTTPGSTATDRPGVFAAGDVQDKVYRQAVTAAGTGCMAALEAEKYLAARDHAAS